MRRRLSFCAGLFLTIAFILFTAIPLNGAMHSRPRRTAPRKTVRAAVPPRPTFADEIAKKYPEFCGTCPAEKEQRPLYRQNDFADHIAPFMLRLEKNEEIYTWFMHGTLVRIPERGDHYFIDPRLKPEFHYAHPIVLDYITELSDAFAAAFPGKMIEISSLVRPQERQASINNRFVITPKGKKRRNPAWVPAAAKCDELEYGHCSVHDTGYVFDITLRPLSRKQVSWLADHSKADADARRILAIYEGKRSGNFHIMVLPKINEQSTLTPAK